MITYITGTVPDGTQGKMMQFTQPAQSDAVVMQIPNITPGDARFSAWVKSTGIGHIWVDVFGKTTIADISSDWTKISADGESVTNGYVRFGLTAPGTLYVHKAKLESGNKATDWSPSPEDPAVGVKTSSIEILDDAILLTSERTSIRVPGEGNEARDMLVVDRDGVTARKYSLPDGGVLETFDGGEYTVGSGGDYATLADAFTADDGIGGCYLSGDVVLSLLGSDPGGTLVGTVGPGKVTIKSSSASAKRAVGRLTFRGCSAEIELSGLTFTGSDANPRITAEYSNLFISGCGFYNSASGAVGLELRGGGAIMQNCSGVCSGYIGRARGGVIHLMGTVPSGAWVGHVDQTEKGSIDTGGSAPPAPTTQTITLYATETGTYIGSGWDTSADRKQLRQGWILSGSKKECFGTALFDMTQIPSGATVQSVKVRLRRISGYGRSGNVTVSVRRSTNAHVSGDVTHAGTAVTKSFGQGDVKNIDITSLYNSNFTGICLDSDDTSDFDGSYSDNYARFTGTGGGEDTRPMLTVTYTI